MNIISKFLVIAGIAAFVLAAVTSQIHIIVVALVILAVSLSLIHLQRKVRRSREVDARTRTEPAVMTPAKIALVCVVAGVISFFLLRYYDGVVYLFMLAVAGFIFAYLYNTVNTFEGGGLLFPGIAVAAVTVPAVCCLAVTGFGAPFGPSLAGQAAVVCIVAAGSGVILFVAARIKQLVLKRVLHRRDALPSFNFNLSFAVAGMIVISIGVLAAGSSVTSVFLPDMAPPSAQVSMELPQIPRLFPTYEERQHLIRPINLSAAVPKQEKTVLGTADSMNRFNTMLVDSGDQLVLLFADSMNILGLGNTEYVANMTGTLQKAANTSRPAATKSTPPG